MIAMYLMLSVGQAGVISNLSPEEIHMAECRPNVQEQTRKKGAEGEIAAWKACLESAKSKSLARIVPDLKGRILERELHRDYAKMAQENPIGFSKVIVASAAQAANTRLPVEVLKEHWQRLLDDSQTRGNMADIRTVAVRFLPHNSLTEDVQVQLDDHVRRQLADLGLKAPPADSQDAAEAPIVVQISPLFETLTPTVDDERGRLHKVGFQLKANSVRFKTRGNRSGGFRVGHAVEDAHVSVAVEQAIDGVSVKFADAFLTILVRETFSNYPIPEP
jgi:hypothetical protein